MDIRRLRPADWLSGLAGLVLLLSLWAPWYEVADGGLTAWESFVVVDLWLLLLALMAIAIPLITAARDSPSVPVALDALTITVGAIAVLLMLWRLLALPDGAVTTGRGWGVWLGAVATLAAFAGAWWALRDESGPHLKPAPAPQRMPAPRA